MYILNCLIYICLLLYNLLRKIWRVHIFIVKIVEFIYVIEVYPSFAFVFFLPLKK